jgi:hypothetical protein
MAKNDSETTASQTFKTEKSCKHVIRFAPDGKAEVGDKSVDEISSSIYVDKRVLDALGNPEKIIVTVAAA